jgi:hypothetical protein
MISNNYCINMAIENRAVENIFTESGSFAANPGKPALQRTRSATHIPAPYRPASRRHLDQFALLGGGDSESYKIYYVNYEISLVLLLLPPLPGPLFGSSSPSLGWDRFNSLVGQTAREKRILRSLRAKARALKRSGRFPKLFAIE